MKIELDKEYQKLACENEYKYLTEEPKGKYRELDNKTREKIREFVRKVYKEDYECEPKEIYIYDEYLNKLENALISKVGKGIKEYLNYIDFNKMIYEEILNRKMIWYIVEVENNDGTINYVVLACHR